MRSGQTLYVVADDELHLGVFEDTVAAGTAPGPGDLVRLLEGLLPTDPAQRKKAKPDFETLTHLPYQFRTEEARYSRRVEMAEIEKNDFNLNISRYISTAVGEAEIDLEATHGELRLKSHCGGKAKAQRLLERAGAKSFAVSGLVKKYGDQEVPQCPRPPRTGVPGL